MNRMLRIVVAVAVAGLTLPAAGRAADQCPPELTQAKAALVRAQAAQKSASQTAKSQEVQAPRTLAGARTQELQAPRAQELQAPRAQELQAPRAQELQAPRAQELQAPRAAAGAKSVDVQAQRINKAKTLIMEGDAACKRGDMALATQKAKDALAVLK